MAADLKNGCQLGASGNAGDRSDVASRGAVPNEGAHCEEGGANKTLSERGKLAGTGMTHYFDEAGLIDLDRVTDGFHVTKGQLAKITGLNFVAVSKADQQTAPRTQSRVREMLEIISRVIEWTGGTNQALAWYRSEPIPPLGRTAEALVKNGKADAVCRYLDRVAVGGYA
ncbi:XRE family transcriptional regulator [Pacificimonas flava]|uniref:XRE family transcriptional regulator n=1 Tax=Pacificimonas flava TaxID=1234595 RepID=UPI00183E903F|nr:XRE family transcriptional regulator [Pacificimonas flava]MBB5279061.1 ethanolamine utilization protein EutA (predicted chaperonin) [Pacificimonas flava]